MVTAAVATEYDAESRPNFAATPPEVPMHQKYVEQQAKEARRKESSAEEFTETHLPKACGTLVRLK